LHWRPSQSAFKQQIMTEEEIIASGLLELYVTGSLSAEEIQEVESAMTKYPSVKKEVAKIEASLLHLSETVGGEVSPEVWPRISQKTNNVRSMETPKRNWNALTGWAAAILFFGGLVYLLKQNSDLNGTLRKVRTQNVVINEQSEKAQIQLAEATDLLEVVRSNNFKAIQLPGNVAVAPTAYATVYYNSDEQIAYIDAKGLPKPPKGKVYQVWSLIMDPLTPRSIGLLDASQGNTMEFYKVENVPTPEAFGITLEPEGGSEQPTLSQLYTLGTVTP